MRGLVSAISVGKVGDQVVVDLNKEEEDYEGGSTDIPIAMLLPDEKITLLQLDGNIKKEEFLKALEYGKKICSEIYKIQVKALKDKYKKWKKN